MIRAWWAVSATLAIVIAGCAQAPASSVVVPSSGPCAGIPAIDRNAPPDNLSLTPDVTLEGELPAQVDGQTVTDVSSGRYIETLCMLGGDASVAAAALNAPGGVDINAVSVASASVIVDGQRETISAYRLPGGRADALIGVIGIFSGSVAGEPKFGGDLGQSTIGGKVVSTWTNAADGATSYLYPTGDTLFVVEDVTESQAGKIFAALP